MSRDVELVIRAKDAATKAIDSIADALKDLAGVQNDVAKSASKTDSLLGDLGAQLNKLNAEAKGLSALGKVATELDKAGGAVSRLEGDVRKSATEFVRLARETEEATKSATRLASQLDAEKRALESNVVAQREARKELTAANRLVREAERNQERYNKALSNVPETKRSSAARSASAFIDADLAASRATQAQATAEIANLKRAVDGSKDAIKSLEPQVASAAAQQRKLASETEKTSGALSRVKGDLSTARTELTSITTAANAASTAFTGTALNGDKVAESSARMAAELARTKARIDGLNQASKAQPKTAVTADVSGVEQQRRKLLELRREWVESEAEVKRLAQAMRATTTPTEEMGRAFGAAQAAARLAKQEYQGQQSALKALAGSATGSFAAFEAGAAKLKTSAERQSEALRTSANFAKGLSSALPPIAAASRSSADALDGAAGGGRRFREALGLVSDGSRQSASFLQGLKGQLVSVTAGFVGLYGAADQIGRILTSFQTLEGAQAKLGVAFNGDSGKVASELQFLERESQRLGISFGVLSDQYGKFAIAAQAANFTSEATRKVFISVAEAGRVSRLSTDELNGVFLALTQMLSKGKVTAEELRGQLGERLSGAFNIFASAIGVTTAELDKMLQKGEVVANSSTLVKFAEELDKLFGGQLAESLRGTTAEMGRFADNIFESQIRIAEGGFAEAFTNGLRTLNESFQSREGRDFFLSLGSALGKFATALAEVPKYFGFISTAVQVLVGYKLGSYFAGIVTNIRATQGSVTGFLKSFYQFNGAVQGAATQIAAFAGSGQALSGTVGTLRTQFIGASSGIALLTSGSRAAQIGIASLRATMITIAGTARIMWTAIGGLPGLVFTGITLALGKWLTSVEDTTTAIDEHKRIMGEVITAYETVNDRTKDWAKTVKNVSLDQANANVRAMRIEFEKARDAVKGFDFGAFNLSGIRRDPGQFALGQQMSDLKTRFEAGEISAKQFREELEKVYAEAKNDGLREAGEALLAVARNAEENETRLGQSAAAAKELGSSLEDLKKDAALAGGSIAAVAEGAEDADKKLSKAADVGLAGFNNALGEIRKNITGLGDDLKRLDDIKALDAQYLQAAKLATTMSQILQLNKDYAAAANAINIKAFGGGAGTESAVDMIKGYEGFRSTPYYDVNAYRVGYGSDTVTLSDGTIKKVTEGIAVSETDALRDLVRRIGEFQDVIKGQIGSDRFEAFGQSQQAALTSVAYNYGSLPNDIVTAIKTGNAEAIAAAIRGRAGDNAGVNATRRNSEADTFLSEGDTPKSAQILAENEAKRVAKAKEFNLELENELSLQEQQIANGGKLTQEAFVQKQLAEKQNQAREAGVTLSDTQIERIKVLAAGEYDVANAKREGKTEQQAANVALQDANALLGRRNELQKQLDAALKTGDQNTVASLQLQLADVNAELLKAIENARKLWEKIGGPESKVALTQIGTIELKAKTTGNSLTALGLSTQDLKGAANNFASGIVDSFDAFAQAIANGQNAVKAFGQAFLQMTADILKELAKVALQRAVAGLLGAVFPGAGLAATGHTGGMVGAVGVGMGNSSRSVSPAIFAHAVRFHNGGMPGLGPDEIPIIAKKNEEILTESDPRHRMNGGLAQGGSGGGQSIRNILVLDQESALAHMQSSAGEKVIMTMIKRNAPTIKRMIG